MILTSLVNTDVVFYFLPLQSGSNTYIANSMTLAYFDAADAPQILIFGVTGGVVTLTGYLVDLTQ